jgi:hypothetical protein
LTEWNSEDMSEEFIVSEIIKHWILSETKYKRCLNVYFPYAMERLTEIYYWPRKLYLFMDMSNNILRHGKMISE